MQAFGVFPPFCQNFDTTCFLPNLLAPFNCRLIYMQDCVKQMLQCVYKLWLKERDCGHKWPKWVSSVGSDGLQMKWSTLLLHEHIFFLKSEFFRTSLTGNGQLQNRLEGLCFPSGPGTASGSPWRSWERCWGDGPTARQRSWLYVLFLVIVKCVLTNADVEWHCPYQSWIMSQVHSDVFHFC